MFYLLKGNYKPETFKKQVKRRFDSFCKSKPGRLEYQELLHRQLESSESRTLRLVYRVYIGQHKRIWKLLHYYWV